MVKLIILENYEKINNFIDQSFLHCLLCRCKIQQNSWKMCLAADKIRYYFEQGRKYLAAVNVPEARKDVLMAYTDGMMKRKN